MWFIVKSCTCPNISIYSYSKPLVPWDIELGRVQMPDANLSGFKDPCAMNGVRYLHMTFRHCFLMEGW
jgi:hypothetical protein